MANERINSFKIVAFFLTLIYCLIGSAALAASLTPALQKAKEDAESRGYIFLTSRAEIVELAKKEGKMRFKDMHSYAKRGEFFTHALYLLDGCADVRVRVEECSDIHLRTVPHHFRISTEHIGKRPVLGQRLHARHANSFVGVLPVHAFFCQLHHD